MLEHNRSAPARLCGPLLALLCMSAAALPACSGSERRFPLRDPIWKDSDLKPVKASCRADPTPSDPNHVVCAPEPSFSPIVWDGADNLFFRPLSEALGIVVTGEAVDVNSMDEVPDSSWFTNRLGVRPMSSRELLLGDCEPVQIVDPDQFADGSWVIDKGKMGGSTDGFRVVIPGKGKYLLKAEDNTESEHSSAAQTVGAAVYHAAGYYTTCEQVIYFKPSLLKLNPGLRWKHNFGDETDFDQAALDKVLAHCPTKGGAVRMQASEWLPGYSVGPFKYLGTRSDDPNDVIPHDDRRELRGMRVLASWIDRFDARSANTLDTWMAEDKNAPDTSPGHLIHNQMDTSEALGSEWQWDPISKRLGRSYVLDWGDLSSDFFSLGIPIRSWDTAEKVAGKETFAYFRADDFVPDQWKNEYPNAAFSRMTERDAAWMARILARFTPEAIHGIAGLARYSDPANTAYLESVLQRRLSKILDRYLTRLSSITDLQVEGTDKLCGVDLAELKGLRTADTFQYHARLLGGSWISAVERRPGGGVCVTLPHTAPNGGSPDDAQERYIRVRFEDGVAPGYLIAHLYDLGPMRGFRLVGLERPER